MKLVRLAVGRWLVHFGVKIMPKGRSKTELLDLLQIWRAKVAATITSKTRKI